MEFQLLVKVITTLGMDASKSRAAIKRRLLSTVRETGTKNPVALGKECYTLLHISLLEPFTGTD